MYISESKRHLEQTDMQFARVIYRFERENEKKRKFFFFVCSTPLMCVTNAKSLISYYNENITLVLSFSYTP
jgi:hypothetical protein